LITDHGRDPVTIESPRSQFRQLADLIRGAIERGEYAPGSPLPAEDELARQYGVSRRTINQAMRILRAEGLLKVQRGRGTIVRQIPVIHRDAVGRQHTREAGGARGAFQAELERLGLTARSDVEISEAAAPEGVAALLAVEPGAPVLARSRRMFANDVPVMLATSYLPLDIAAGTQLAEADTGPGGTYSRLGELGHAPVTFTETVTVRSPEDSEAAELGMDAEQRVFAIRRTAEDAARRVVEVNDMTLPVHQWELAYQWAAD
jgi:GntR family transcriptional regulator